MTVLTQALRRLEEQTASERLPPPAPRVPGGLQTAELLAMAPMAAEGLGSTPPSARAEPPAAAWAPPIGAVDFLSALIDNQPDGEQPEREQPEREQSGREQTTLREQTTFALVDAEQAETEQTGPAAASEPLAVGKLLLACDLTIDDDRGLALASRLAFDRRGAELDDVAVVAVNRCNQACPLGDHFTETNEPGLFARRLLIGESSTACRGLLVLFDECRRRFSQTVLLVAGEDDLALRLSAPRVDETVLLTTPDRTPEAALLRIESRLRTHAPLIPQRTLVAA